MRKCNKNTFRSVLIGFGILIIILCCLLEFLTWFIPYNCDIDDLSDEYNKRCPHPCHGNAIIVKGEWIIALKNPYYEQEKNLTKTFSCKNLTEDLDINRIFEKEYIVWLIEQDPSLNSSEDNCTLIIHPGGICPPGVNSQGLCSYT